MRKEEKTWGMLCHLLALSGLIIPVGVILGPLIMWLVKKDESEFVDYHGKESLNFQITMLIGIIIGFITSVIFIGFIIITACGLLSLIFAIIAAIKANEGERYEYPFALRLIK